MRGCAWAGTLRHPHPGGGGLEPVVKSDWVLGQGTSARRPLMVRKAHFGANFPQTSRHRPPWGLLPAQALRGPSVWVTFSAAVCKQNTPHPPVLVTVIGSRRQARLSGMVARPVSLPLPGGLPAGNGNKGKPKDRSNSISSAELQPPKVCRCLGPLSGAGHQDGVIWNCIVLGGGQRK